MPRNPDKIRCAVPGCHAWAIRGSDPPRCSPHRGQSGPEPGPGVGAPPGNQNHLVHGFYATVLHPEELAGLTTYAADATLDAEIVITRVALRRILGMLLSGTTPAPNPRSLEAEDYARFTALAFQGACTLSRLLRARQALPGASPLVSFLDQVLEELGKEWGIPL
jgi:hypothetical protein